MDATNIKAAVDLRDIAGQWTQLQRKNGQESEGPCPRCGGTDRFTVRRDAWFCRQCAPAAKGAGRRDVVDFLQWVGAAHDYASAVRWLEGYTGMRAATAPAPDPAVRAARAAVSAATWTHPAWQREARQVAAMAVRWLQGNDSMLSTVGVEYLASRGLDMMTAAAWRVGVGSIHNSDTDGPEPAIMLPWYVGDDVTAIEWRFVRPAPVAKPQRYKRWKWAIAGKSYVGDAVLAVGPRRWEDVLFVTEGYMNAMAIWQVGYDAASFGSKDNMSPATIEAARDLAGAYAATIVWADEGSDAATIAGALDATPVRSPGGNDANDLLLSGRLAGVLAVLAERIADVKRDFHS